MRKCLILSVFLLFIIASFIAFSVSASSGKVSKELSYNNIKITLDGKEVVPKNANGEYVEPFIIDGTTYLPVRGIATALGLDVGWDGQTKTVMLSSPAASSFTAASTDKSQELNGILVSLLSVTQYDGDAYGLNDGRDFLVFEFELKNVSDEEISAATIFSFRMFVDDYSVQRDISAASAIGLRELLGELPAGKAMRGVVCCAAPADWNTAEIRYTRDYQHETEVIFTVNRSEFGS